jgi:hypothetical protein
MLFAADSPFVRLPRDLNPKQALFLDGIRFAAEMTALAYARLCGTLYGLAMRETRDNADVGEGAVAALLDAWSIVDAVNRLRDLQRQMPGLKKRDGYKAFMSRTEPFAQLRNIVQHLNNEIDNMVRRKAAVYGTLRWFTMYDRQNLLGKSCVLVAGRLTDGQHPIVNPAGKLVHGPVDHVTIACKGLEASLSDGYRTVADAVHAMEPALRESFKDLPLAGTDALMIASMKFFDPERGPPSE